MNQTPKLDETKLTPEQRDKLEAYRQAQSQIQALNDIADMTQEMVNILDEQKKMESTDNKQMGALLADMRNALQAMNDKEAPEQPDTAKPVVDALSKLEKALTAAIKAIDTQPKSPDVNVQAPAVDLSGIEKAVDKIPKAFEQAIKLINIPEVEIPEAPDRWDEVLEWLQSIDTATRMKPIPGTMKVSNPDGSQIGSGGVFSTQLNAPQETVIGSIANASTIVSMDDLEGIGSVTVSIFGTYVGLNATFEVFDGANWVSMVAIPISSVAPTPIAGATGVLTSNSTNVWNVSPLLGIVGFRVRSTAFTSGVATVRIEPCARFVQPNVIVSQPTAANLNANIGTLTTITNWGNIVDNAAFTDGTTRLSPSGYIFDEVAGTALTENDAAAARVDSKRAQIITLEDATTRGHRLAIGADGAMATTPSRFSSSTGSNVAASATSVTLKAANSARKELKIQNDSTAILYVKEGATASSTNYTYKLYQDDIYITNNYTGIVDGIWASATGTARVTES